MAKISSFNVAVGLSARVALKNISGLAIAIVMPGTANSAQARSFGKPCTAAPRSKWLSIGAMQSKAEAIGYKVLGARSKNCCGEFFVLEISNRIERFDPASSKIVGR